MGADDDDLERQIREQQQARGTGFNDVAADDETYTKDRFAGFEGSIAAGDEEEDDGTAAAPTKRATFTAPQHLLDVPQQEAEDPMLAREKSNRIADREDAYHARRQRVLSPSRADAFALGDKTPDVSTRSYKDVMAEQQNAREREELKKKIAEQAEADKADPAAAKKRRRWDQPVGAGGAGAAADGKKTKWDNSATPAPSSSWDATPAPGGGGGGSSSAAAAGGSRWDATPTPGRVVETSKWDATPTPGRVVDSSKWDATPTPGRVVDGSKCA